ncbi:conserved hypothetical protein, contains Thioredoxin domain [Nitrospina gracilis 3/211]|uniref:Spermatogenesis-associated protein 20-like TRX domain-containing protein n=1 Tax=Nitrospina gracilis (strain 3/211) TaxID=1266370 RepID=M1YYL5_NITG3|nr:MULTISPECIES: thioredoxin domain-containing protein [Nitrospina]MCF8723504.1 uncharacterized protein YyaL (SSP411 family) [Nitrospina sp. Nb-3]CCQ90575.1 conserved hypothetical protein, contains Thioredoxin domain [Nitrospina gracilis 3/211]
MTEHKYTNKLIHEKSPYLLQHAHNPVDWHPWGPEAFELAKKANKPLLVSIGYATCHWCHVMERESFEDPEIAEYLNAHFVPIKVDREERPDVDSIYMKSVQAFGQQGGWPLNVFVTPDGVPFYGGTYYPSVGRYGLPSFLEVLTFLDKTWREEPEKVEKQSTALINYLKDVSKQEQNTEGTVDDLGFHGENKTREFYTQSYDRLHHGFLFQQQNKFPPSMGLSLLLRHHHRTGDALSLEMVENTLRAMKQGGIYDQIGGGLARYSTDHQWLVPHFEKMLYDNGLFVTALIETYQVTGKREFADYANDVLQYIDRDMTSAEGAFYSAEDADSEGVEGKFYVWTQEEIEKVLGRETASIAIPYYNVLPNGNWEGKNILHVKRPPEQIAKDLGLPLDHVEAKIAEAREKLLAVRSQRIRPLLDDKILTSWNGLMIRAMAQVGRVLDDADRIAKAEKALHFIWNNLRTPEGKLLRRWREGEARYDGYLCDYTSIALACCDLYEATYNPDYINKAEALMKTVEEKFGNQGAYYETASDAEELIVRQVSGYDGVEPSGNSSAAMALLKLAALTQNVDYERRAEKIFLAFSDEVTEYGINSSFMMQALHLYLGGCKQVAVRGVNSDKGLDAFWPLMRRRFFPNAVFAFSLDGDADAQRVPLLAGKESLQGKTTAYVCQHGSCLPPVTQVTELKNLVDDYRQVRD